MELTVPGQGGTANATVLLYRNDDTCQLAGTIFYGTVDTTSSATPPSNDEVSMDFEYSTGIGTWTAKFPYKTTEWGWYQYTNIKGVQGLAGETFQEKLRVLTIPSMDYTSATLRPVLQQLLNEEPFRGTNPLGSGSEYVVEGADKEIRIRLKDTGRPGTDKFLIASDQYMKLFTTRSAYPGQYEATNLRSANALLGLDLSLIHI